MGTRLHADPIGLVHLAQRAGQADDRMLVGPVNRVKRCGDQAGHRRRGHDRPSAARDDGGTGGRDAVDHAVEVDGHRPPVRLRVEIVTHAAPGGDAGVEMRDVEPAERSTASATAAALAAGSVTSVWMKRPPSSSATALPRATSMSANHDMGAPARQVPGDALSDAVAASGDESDLAVDVECHNRIVGERRVSPHRSAQLERGGEWSAWTTLRC